MLREGRIAERGGQAVRQKVQRGIRHLREVIQGKCCMLKRFEGLEDRLFFSFRYHVESNFLSGRGSGKETTPHRSYPKLIGLSQNQPMDARCFSIRAGIGHVPEK